MRIPFALGLLALSSSLLTVSACGPKTIKTTPADSNMPAPSAETPPLPPPPPDVTSEAVEGRDLAPIFFGFDSHALDDAAREMLDRNARALRATPSLRITIEGHCDERGTVEYNLALGERRAHAARDYLVAAGVDPSRIHTVSYGKERPFDTGRHEAAWAQNRRAHMVAAGAVSGW
jgi:peptidoglycan-associated lipoprotein